MSEMELYAAAWAGIITLWAVVIGLFMADAGIDPARIPVFGPIFERTWTALVSGLRKVLRIKD